MAEDDKCFPQPLFCRDLRWDPFRGWPQQSRVFDQDFGMPPFPTPSDSPWQPSTSSWQGYTRAPLFSSSAQTPLYPSPKTRHLQSGGVSEILTGQDRWQVNLDVNQFSPEEISIKAKEGYLEITGKHEERQDEHGSISRYFTRRYELPAGVDLERVSSSLSGDGVLSVEGPLPASAVPAETAIPIQVGEQLKPSGCEVKEDQVEAKTEETTGGEESEKQAAGTDEVQTQPILVPSDQPERGDQPQEAPADQSEPFNEQGEELQADSSEMMVMAEERVAVSGGEQAPTWPEGDAGEDQVDSKPAEEEDDVEKEPQEVSGDLEEQAALNEGEEEYKETSEPASETGPQQEPAEGRVQEPLEEPTEIPEPAPIHEAQDPEQDIPDLREIEQVELAKGPPEP